MSHCSQLTMTMTILTIQFSQLQDSNLHMLGTSGAGEVEGTAGKLGGRGLWRCLASGVSQMAPSDRQHVQE